MIAKNAQKDCSGKTSTFRAVLEGICADCAEWNEQHSYYHLEEIERRRAAASTVKELVRGFVGALVYPRFRGADPVYLFEGLRNKEYMATFNRHSVVLIGSHAEKDFARERGYGFVWSFPLESAVRAKIYRNWNFLALVQMLLWRRALKAKRSVVFFLYEDTQPLGTFLVHMARDLLCNAKSVCIQHGYFSALTHPLRYEGVRSDINFVWDDRQTRLMGLDPARTFPIGLPYAAAKARQTKYLLVVLVGVGAPYGDPVSYRAALDSFEAVARVAEDQLGLEVTYRPHPTEAAHPEVIDLLTRRFKAVDTLGKLDRLNGGKSIYVGTVSSLMYEAKQAGHLVVCLQIQDREIPVFDFDLMLRPQELGEFATWARGILNSLEVREDAEEEAAGDSHLVRFRNAVVEAKLPLC